MTTRSTRRTAGAALAALTALGAPAPGVPGPGAPGSVPGVRPLGAQPVTRGAPALTGVVVHAETGAPIEAATVVLAPATPGALPDAADPFVAAARATRTDATGRYRFQGLPAGAYVLRVQRLGFHPATVDVEFRGGDSRVSVGLTVATVRLSAVAVAAPAPEPYARRATAVTEQGAARRTALRARQRAHLATDVRELTHVDVTESVTLGETDLFRALQRLPGVSGRNALSAELWTRGARWDQTRVTFDGMPLFNPLHGLGLLSAVNADAVGAAFLHPGVRPASLGEGGAAVLDLRSRPGGGDGGLRGVGELSLLSARAALDQRVGGGRGAWMVAGRRTYLDLLLPRVLSGPESRFPYHFAELTARGDWTLAPGHRIEVSTLLEQDRLAGDIPDVSQGNRARWGNAMAQAAVTTQVGVLEARHAVGVSRFRGQLTLAPVDSALEASYGDVPERPVRAGVTHLALRGSWAPIDSGARRPAWDAGYALERQAADYLGEVRAVYLGEASARDTSAGRAALTQLAVWGARRFAPVDGLVLEAGMRVEAGGAVRGGGRVRPGPRLTARYARGETAVSGALGRSWQYAQARTAQGTVAPNATTHPVPLWLVADATTPALRADIATLGVERWLGAGWHATLNAYARRSAGVLLPDPRPGPVVGQAVVVEGRERAHGVELAARRVEGRWTLAAGYAYGVARGEALGLRFPTAEDRRHTLDVTTMVRATRTLRVGAAYASAAGSPYTRRLIVPDATGWAVHADGPNAQRLPSYASLDLVLDWSGQVGGARVGTFVQLHNALGRRNPTGYQGPSHCMGTTRPGAPCPVVDTFEDGLPIVPVLGLRLTF